MTVPDQMRRKTASELAAIARTTDSTHELHAAIRELELRADAPEFCELHCDDCGHVETIPAHDDRPPRCENCGRRNVERRKFGTGAQL